MSARKKQRTSVKRKVTEEPDTAAAPAASASAAAADVATDEDSKKEHTKPARKSAPALAGVKEPVEFNAIMAEIEKETRAKKRDDIKRIRAEKRKVLRAQTVKYLEDRIEWMYTDPSQDQAEMKLSNAGLSSFDGLFEPFMDEFCEFWGVHMTTDMESALSTGEFILQLDDANEGCEIRD